MLEVSLHIRKILFFLLKHCTRKKRCETGSAQARKRDFRRFHVTGLRKFTELFYCAKHHKKLSHHGW